MALEALWVQATSYPARVDRLLIESVLTEGVLNVAGGELLVRQRAAGANMSVEIDPGRVAITGDDQANQGRYLGRSTAVESRTVTAAPGSGSRIDLVVARVADASVTGVVNGLLLEVIAGTPHATTPVVPATPNGAVPLARIAVASGQVSVVTANITDLRPAAQTADFNRRAVRTQAVANQTGIVAEADLTNLTAGVGAPGLPASRRLKISASLHVFSTVAQDSFSVRLYQDGVRVGSGEGQVITANSQVPVCFFVDVTPAAGAHVWKLTLVRTAGTGNVALFASSAVPATLLIEDIGPA